MKIIVLLLLKVSLNKHISLSLNKALMKTTIRNFFFSLLFGSSEILNNFSSCSQSPTLPIIKLRHRRISNFLFRITSVVLCYQGLWIELHNLKFKIIFILLKKAIKCMNPLWVTLDTSFLSPPYAVPSIAKCNLHNLHLFLSFHFTSRQPTPNQHWSPNRSVTCFPFSFCPYTAMVIFSKDQTNHHHTNLLTQPHPPPPTLQASQMAFMVQKTLRALFLLSTRPVRDPSYLPAHLMLYSLLLSALHSTFLAPSCPHTAHTPFQHRGLGYAVFCYLSPSPDSTFKSQIKHHMRKTSLTSAAMGTLSFTVLFTSSQLFWFD